ncbi:MAG: tyrosine-type recombinase/integrase, partial [Thermoleophilia bacterium]
ALRLHPKDLGAGGVGGATGAVRVLWGKGGKARTVGVDPGGLALVAAWAAVRQTALDRRGPGVADRAPLFCTREGKPMTSGWVRRLMPRLARRAGIFKRVHAHGLRHTHAAQLRAEGVDIAVIRRQLGHTSIVTTVRYLDHLNPVAVVEAMAKRAW